MKISIVTMTMILLMTMTMMLLMMTQRCIWDTNQAAPEVL